MIGKRTLMAGSGSLLATSSLVPSAAHGDPLTLAALWTLFKVGAEILDKVTSVIKNLVSIRQAFAQTTGEIPIQSIGLLDAQSRHLNDLHDFKMLFADATRDHDLSLLTRDIRAAIKTIQESVLPLTGRSRVEEARRNHISLSNLTNSLVDQFDIAGIFPVYAAATAMQLILIQIVINAGDFPTDQRVEFASRLPRSTERRSRIGLTITVPVILLHLPSRCTQNCCLSSVS